MALTVLWGTGESSGLPDDAAAGYSVTSATEVCFPDSFEHLEVVPETTVLIFP